MVYLDALVEQNRLQISKFILDQAECTHVQKVSIIYLYTLFYLLLKKYQSAKPKKKLLHALHKKKRKPKNGREEDDDPLSQ